MLRAALLAVLIVGPVLGQDLKSLKPEGYVSDFSHVLDADSRTRLEEYCGQVERVTGAQMALVTIDTLGDNAIENFTADLFKQWGIGKKGRDEGILFLLAVKDHKDRIEVGYGLEGVLPDGFVGQALREIRPQLRQGDYGGAMLVAAEVMGSTIAKSKGLTLDAHVAERRVPDEQPSRGGGLPWPFIFFGIIILFSILSRIGRRGYYGGYGGGSGCSGCLTGMLLGNLLSGGGRSDWGGGGFGGFGSGGGGGGGGFGGFGGGSSGGGGASGSW